MLIGRRLLLLLGALAITSVAIVQAADSPNDLAGSGYFRDQDTLPGAYRYYQQLPGGEGGLWGLGPSRQQLSRSSFKMDAHDNVTDFSEQVRCQVCHKPQTKDLHWLRMGITCVQCHRNQPVAGIYHYYSALNPIRRHAYVCAKCHEKATPSFASYLVHEPNPIAAETRHSFPLFFYAVWLMLILAVGVFVFFLPYTLLWWLRDVWQMLKRGGYNG